MNNQERASQTLTLRDGRTPEMEAMHLAVTNSIEFTGTADDILATMPPGQ
jgi:hypothetical protein